MRNTLRLLMQREITSRLNDEWLDQLAKKLGDTSDEYLEPEYVLSPHLKYMDCVDALGHEILPYPTIHHVPADILTCAIAQDQCVGVELLALGKPYGDIFRSDHWMWDSVRDYFSSVIKCADYNDW